MLEENRLNNLLVAISDSLDIPDYLYEEAVQKYEEVASWLGEKDSELLRYEPIAYHQGSFRIGTVIKPLSDEDCYDIDFVCRLKLEKNEVTKKDLKKLIGQQLKKNDEFKSKVVEKGRCWTINFSNFFKIDVLPTIPDQDETPNGIWLTDKDIHHWQESNPIDFADWFKAKASLQHGIIKLSLAKSRNIDVAEVADWEVKTPLQRCVQLLKRHRDIYFQDSPNLKPSSIILTTLAAHAFQGHSSLTQEMIYLIQNMGKNIKKENDEYIIKSPVSDENFADKWNLDPEKAKAFQNWINNLNGDLLTALWYKKAELLNLVFGDQLLRKSLSLANGEKTTNAKLAIPPLGDSSHIQSPTWPIVKRYFAKIKAELYLKSKQKKLKNIASEDAVGNGKFIKFTLNTNTEIPYEVQWQVVNTGAGAEINKDLRGEFYPSESGNTRWESTKYNGTHWIEAFVIKDGICVARTGPFYVKIRSSWF